MSKLIAFQCNTCDYVCNLNIKLRNHKLKHHEENHVDNTQNDYSMMLKRLNAQNIRLFKEIRAMKKEFKRELNVLTEAVDNSKRTIIKDTTEKCVTLIDTAVDVRKTLRKVKNKLPKDEVKQLLASKLPLNASNVMPSFKRKGA